MSAIRYHARRASEIQAAKARANDALARSAEAHRLEVASLEEIARQLLVSAAQARKEGKYALAEEAHNRATEAIEHARAARTRIILKGLSRRRDSYELGRIPGVPSDPSP
jgi:hypothetical protein